MLNWNYNGDFFSDNKRYTIKGGVVQKTTTAMTRADVTRRMKAAGRSAWFSKYRWYYEDNLCFAYVDDDMGWIVTVDRYTGEVKEKNLFQRVVDSFII